MAYLSLTRFAGEPAELLRRYELSADALDEVGRDHGLLVHGAGRTSAGLLVVNLWPSPGESESAAADPPRLTALAESGVTPDRVAREHVALDRHVLFAPAAGPDG